MSSAQIVWYIANWLGKAGKKKSIILGGPLGQHQEKQQGESQSNRLRHLPLQSAQV